MDTADCGIGIVARRAADGSESSTLIWSDLGSRAAPRAAAGGSVRAYGVPANSGLVAACDAAFGLGRGAMAAGAAACEDADMDSGGKARAAGETLTILNSVSDSLSKRKCGVSEKLK